MAAPVVALQEAAAPEPAPPEAAAPEPMPELKTTPLPVTLHGVGAGAAQPAAIVSPGVAASIVPRVPASSALPLRPTMVLAPRRVAEPKPVEKPAAVEPVSTAIRPVKGPQNVKRRPEVRVVQSAPVAPKPVTPAPQPAPVAKAAPPAKPVPAPVAPAPVPVTPVAAKPELDLHLPELHNPEVASRWSRMPVAARASIGAVLALGIIGVAYTVFNGSNAGATPTPAAKVVPAYDLGKQINSGGWIEDWAPADTLRRLTLLRGTQPYSDYRMEFDAQIQNKAIGWMYRALNNKNYYVAKLEKLKPGIEPVVALVRYAVIDGSSERRTEKILPMKVRVDTTYKIRFDAVGSEFSVWVQGAKVDEWRDARLGSGGVGLYAEGEEAAAVHGLVNVFELVSAK